ncbi:hypothetical protein [Streptomyces sp. JJ38]|uniref:hypothetical protein n=1 Tax=Streptomyces sp. JJ38 TaxID=2738128 RepID=UPI001C589737|nr:hypothetical protein [Streptomyces sp. JJ38]MBW1596105.1 hypothetical protein [Streptomyces sp. JJ38]
MSENRSVRCPVCRREHRYVPPSYPCPCGAAVVLSLAPGGTPTRIRRRTWAGSWVAVPCGACGRSDDWPQPEVCCPCGALLVLPVDRTGSAGGPEAVGGPVGGSPTDPPVFTPVTIRTARDAVLAAAQYLRWLGFTDIVMAHTPPASGVDLRGRGVVAHIDPSTTPIDASTVETVWLTGMHGSARAVCFALAGYEQEASTRAEAIGVPLFVLDLTGTPQPVNDAAQALVTTRA